MGRHKGSLTIEQKARMQAGRKAKKNSDIEKVSETKTKRKYDIIFGWAVEGKIITPIFDSEKDIYKGEIYRTIEIANKNRKEE